MLCHGWNVSKWIYDTKTNHFYTVDGMLEDGFVVPRQIVLVSRTEC